MAMSKDEEIAAVPLGHEARDKLFLIDPQCTFTVSYSSPLSTLSIFFIFLLLPSFEGRRGPPGAASVVKRFVFHFVSIFLSFSQPPRY